MKWRAEEIAETPIARGCWRMGSVYAVWTGIGAAGGLARGIAVEGEPPTTLRIGCASLILAGVAGLKLGS